jgi:hypothetical protein
MPGVSAASSHLGRTCQVPTSATTWLSLGAQLPKVSPSRQQATGIVFLLTGVAFASAPTNSFGEALPKGRVAIGDVAFLGKAPE